MRWDGLFADLEAQIGGQVEAEDRAVRADEVRLDRGRRTHVARIAELGRTHDVTLRILDGTTLTVRVDQVGAGWLTARTTSGSRRLFIPASAVATARASSSSPAAVADREVDTTALEARIILRDLARRRVPVCIDTLIGPLHGTIDGVGDDHLEVAIHAPGSPRRAREVTAVELIRLSAILTIRY